ncbi:MAG: Protein translocase subunit SecF, partial [uncultured Acidimicrobiales bacterium]
EPGRGPSDVAAAQAVPRRDHDRLRRSPEHLVRGVQRVRPRRPHLAPHPGAELRHRLQRRHLVGGAGTRGVRGGGPRRGSPPGPRRRHHPDHRRRQDPRGIGQRVARAAGPDQPGPGRGGQRRHRTGERQRRGPVMGQGSHQQGPQRPGCLLRPHQHLHLAALRVEDGGGRPVGSRPRHLRHGRGVLDLPVRGDAGDGGRLPHHPGVFALRHHRGVRQGGGERQGAGGFGPVHVLGHGEPVHEPGADALAQHLDRRHHADRGDPGDRRRRPRGHHAERLRPGPARRPAHRRLLLDLHRLADAGHPQGARAPLRQHPPAAHGQGWSRPPHPGCGRGPRRRWRWRQFIAAPPSRRRQERNPHPASGSRRRRRRRRRPARARPSRSFRTGPAAPPEARSPAGRPKAQEEGQEAV